MATHLPPERAAAHVATAQEVTARLLRHVREVAMVLRDTPALDLAEALCALARGAAPGLVVHVAMPDGLRLTDTARGHCIVRCAQEIVTNALRHAQCAEPLGVRSPWRTTPSPSRRTTTDVGPPRSRAGQGLAGMRARFEELGGRLSIAVGDPARAFAVSAWLPTKGGAS